jgi:hypothetical protein
MLLLNALTGALAVSVVTVSSLATRSAADKSISGDLAGARATSGAADLAPFGAGHSDDFSVAIASRDWRMIVLHHSATAGGSVESIDAVHRRQRDRDGKPWLGIGYHFVIGNGQPMADGEIRPTFRWLEQLSGAHAGKREINDEGIGVCLIGNFDEAPPTERQIAAVGNLLGTLARRYSIPRERIVRHQDVQATRCPGRWFPMDMLLAGLPPATR